MSLVTAECEALVSNPSALIVDVENACPVGLSNLRKVRASQVSFFGRVCDAGCSRRK